MRFGCYLCGSYKLLHDDCIVMVYYVRHCGDGGGTWGESEVGWERIALRNWNSAVLGARVLGWGEQGVRVVIVLVFGA